MAEVRGDSAGGDCGTHTETQGPSSHLGVWGGVPSGGLTPLVLLDGSRWPTDLFEAVCLQVWGVIPPLATGLGLEATLRKIVSN